MCSPSTMDKGTVGADHPFLMCVQRGDSCKWHGSRRVSLHSLKEGGVLPSPRTSHIFSLYVGGFQAQVNWQCHSCGIGQKVKDGLQPPSSLAGGKEPTGCLLLSHGGWKHRDGRMLSTALSGNFALCQGKPECLSKRSGTELSSEKEHEIIKQRHIAPGWLSHHSLPSWAGTCVTSSCRFWRCLWAPCLPVTQSHLLGKMGGAWWWDAQSPQRLIERGQSCHSARMHPCAALVALTSFPNNIVSQTSCHSMYRTLLLKCEAVYHPSL